MSDTQLINERSITERGNTKETSMRALSMAEAMAIIEATFAKAAEMKLRPLAAMVLDAGGRPKVFMKQDGASLMRYEISYGKAFAALAMGRSSKMVLQKSREKPMFMQNLLELADGPMFLEGGGQLIRDKSGEVVGAIGVTGDVNETDDASAISGIHACGFKTDEDFDDRMANVKR